MRILTQLEYEIFIQYLIDRIYDIKDEEEKQKLIDDLKYMITHEI